MSKKRIIRVVVGVLMLAALLFCIYRAMLAAPAPEEPGRGDGDRRDRAARRERRALRERSAQPRSQPHAGAYPHARAHPRACPTWTSPPEEFKVAEPRQQHRRLHARARRGRERPELRRSRGGRPGGVHRRGARAGPVGLPLLHLPRLRHADLPLQPQGLAVRRGDRQDHSRAPRAPASTSSDSPRTSRTNTTSSRTRALRTRSSSSG